MTRPQLGPIKPGDPVVITDPDAARYRDPHQPGFVVKAARVWITVCAGTPDNPGREYRMRRDTQNEATGFGYGGRKFATPEQHAWGERLAQADQFLREQGIELRFSSPWHAPEKRLQLADLIRATETA